jgi:RNase P/RNase MRP subunit p30
MLSKYLGDTERWLRQALNRHDVDLLFLCYRNAQDDRVIVCHGTSSYALEL